MGPDPDQTTCPAVLVVPAILGTEQRRGETDSQSPLAHGVRTGEQIGLGRGRDLAPEEVDDPIVADHPVEAVNHRRPPA
jgi:hypothetical protein